jgi:hypothetical protein
VIRQRRRHRDRLLDRGVIFERRRRQVRIDRIRMRGGETCVISRETSTPVRALRRQ